MITVEEVNYKRSNCTVKFSDNNSYKVHLDIIIKYNIHENMQLTMQKYKCILNENEKLMATNLAVRYTQTSIKTKKQVVDYLLKKDISKVHIDEIIDKLIEYRFINDEEYAKMYVRTYKNKFGKYKISQNLYQKGIDKKYIEEALLQIDNVQDTLYNIASKYLNKKEKSLQNFNKLYRFLIGRGFEYEEVSRVIDIIKSESKNY